jgi:hypothetical protein
MYMNYVVKKLSSLLSLQPRWTMASDFQFHDHFTDGMTLWTSEQLVACEETYLDINVQNPVSKTLNRQTF